MDEMRLDHPGIAIQTWCEPQLLDLFDMLTENAKRTLFGPVPDPATANDMTLDDIEPVVEKLESLPLEVAEGPLPAPTLEKLEMNELSNYVKILLRNGRLKDRLVRKYFEKGVVVEKGEQIAVAIRAKYAECKVQGLTPDEIFERMQLFVGYGGVPRRQVASMAVIAYFFERCDIFENPDERATDQ